MERKKQPKWKRLLPPVLWSMAGIGLFILLVSASGRNENLKCTGLEISIDGYKHEMFISEADVKSLVEEDLSHKVKGCRIGLMDLRRLEAGLQRDNWVSKAQLFIDNKQVLHVNISERLPVARIFTQGNRSYYIDSQAVVLPLSAQQVADVPVFTNVPDRPKKLAGNDSLFWKQLGQMGNYIISDSFLLMQIGQVNINSEKELEIYPVVGNHLILLGTPENFQQKLVRMKKFDQQVLAKAGLSKYSRLDLRYDKQIVATLRGKEDLPTSNLNIAPDIEHSGITQALAQQEIQPDAIESQKPKSEEPVKQTTAAIFKLAPNNKKEISSAPKKAPVKQETVKTEKKKTEVKVAKTVAATPQKKTVVKTEKIVAASNNKPTKKALEQLPKKTEKSGLIEIDIRHKPDNSKEAKAVMPKKN